MCQAARVDWITHRSEDRAHAVAWRSNDGPPYGYGTICSHLSGATGWSPAGQGDRKCRDCSSMLADAERQQAEAERDPEA